MYTSVGGLKAVVWTDTLQVLYQLTQYCNNFRLKLTTNFLQKTKRLHFQAGVMYAGLGLLIVKGLIDAGGFTRVWEVAIDGKRVADLKYLSPDPAQVSLQFRLQYLYKRTIFSSLAFGLLHSAVSRTFSPSTVSIRWPFNATARCRQ
jgi:Na+/proline symporter